MPPIPSMRGPRGLTAGQREEIIARYEAGERLAELAAAFGKSKGSIHWFLLQEGVDPPRPVHVARTPAAPVTHRRGDHLVRRFTTEDDRRLLQLEAAGETIAAISRALGRKPNSVRGRLATLARHERLAEERAR